MLADSTEGDEKQETESVSIVKVEITIFILNNDINGLLRERWEDEVQGISYICDCASTRQLLNE